MKKLYAFLLVALLGLVGFASSAASFTLKVEGSGSATLTDYQTDDFVKVVEAGQTYTINLPAMHQVLVISPDDNVSVVSIENSYSFTGDPYIGGSYKFDPFDGDEWTLVLKSTGAGPVNPPVAEGTLFNVAPGGSAKLVKFSNTSFEYELVAELPEGETRLKLSDTFDDDYCIYGNNGQIIKSVIADGSPIYQKIDDVTKEPYVQFYGDELAARYEIETQAVPMFFTIIIDDPTAAIVRLNYKTLTLQPGENKVPMSAATEPIMILPQGSAPQYVKVNGVDQGSIMVYRFNVNRNDIVDIKCKASDVTHTYTMVFEDEGASEFWTRAAVDGVDVDLSDGTIKAKAGQKVQLWNTNGLDWIVYSYSLPDGNSLSGNPLVFSGQYPVSFTAPDNDGEIKVNAKRSPKSKVNFNISGSEYVRVLIGSHMSTQEITGLHDGGQTVELTNSQLKNLSVVLKDSDKGYIRSVSYFTAPGKEETKSVYNSMMEYYPISNLEDGASVNIVALAEPGTFDIIVNVNNPGDIKLYASNMDQPAEIPFEFKAGENIVPFPENKIQLFIRPSKNDSFINSVKYRKSIAEDASAAIDAEPESNYFYINFPKEGYVIDVDASHVEYNDHSLIYVDNVKAVLAGVVIESKDGRSVKLSSGYNDFTFNEDENGDEGFTIRLQGNASLKVFANNEPVAKEFDDATTASVVLSPGDVIKVYIENTDPKMINVAFSAESANDIELPVAAHIVEVDLAEVEPVAAMPSFSALPGTRIRFKVGFDDPSDETQPSLESYKVMVADNEAAADDDGIYTLDVPAADAAVRIVYTAKPGKDGITVISRDSDFSDATYFDLQGRPILRPSAGLYIRVAGSTATKVLVK